MVSPNPYDELSYRCRPIEWTAPERLALASMMHGGPKPPISDYRVLELGCGNGANLLPMAHFRQEATFVGVDGAATQVAVAERHKAMLNLSNISFIQADFCCADEYLDGKFDYIIAHGVFSWISDDARDALLSLCKARLRRGGLLYVNYNTYPGWTVRGLVRNFLSAQTSGTESLLARARYAQALAAQVAASLGESGGAELHPYHRLMANELDFVCEHDPSYVAHEYLAAYNQAYWRSDFTKLVNSYGLEYVADADFNYPTGRISTDLVEELARQYPEQSHVEDTLDLLSYRQLHSPILTIGPIATRAFDIHEFADLVVASCLARRAPIDNSNPMFEHPSGYQVEAKEPSMSTALSTLERLWPKGMRIRELFVDVGHALPDLTLLYRNGLIALRYQEPTKSGPSSEELKRLEFQSGGYFTTPYHVCMPCVS